MKGTTIRNRDFHRINKKEPQLSLDSSMLALEFFLHKRIDPIYVSKEKTDTSPVKRKV